MKRKNNGFSKSDFVPEEKHEQADEDLLSQYQTNNPTVVEVAKSEVGLCSDSTHVEPRNDSTHISLQEHQSSISHCLLMFLQLPKKVYLAKRVS